MGNLPRHDDSRSHLSTGRNSLYYHGMVRVFLWTSSTISSSNSSLEEIPDPELSGENVSRPTLVAGCTGDICDHGITYTSSGLDFAQQQHEFLQSLPDWNQVQAHDYTHPRVPFPRNRVNMKVTVDLAGILPEALQDPRAGSPVLNLDSISLLNFNSECQLQNFTVVFVKQAIQDLCWNCFRIAIRKRNFKMWLQVLPPDTPLFPYGRFEPLDYDSTWREVLNIHQIPLAAECLHLRAYHPEGLFD